MQETTRELLKSIREVDTVFIYAQNSGIHFSASKAMAKTIARKSDQSQNFRFVHSGSVLTLYV